ncbi:MAG: extracellular solute-binding protein [Chloroflexi bacterium]|nr:extracellular solute-binding protein [Chloroflexota bacterium]
MNRKEIARVAFAGLLALSLVIASCASVQQPAPPAAAPGQGAAPLQGWEADWQRVLAAARQEGPLNIYSPAAADLRVGMTEAFKEKYGLDIEWTAGKAAELAEKYLRERQAGLHIADLMMGSTQRQLTVMKPGGMLEPIKPLIILPEVLDMKLWFQGEIPWVDNEKMYTMESILAPDYKVAVNTKMVRPEEIASYNDLLNPKWKGKIVVGNPVLTMKLFSQISTVMGPDWWRKLVANDPVIVDDNRLGTEWLAHGKYPIAILPRQDIREEFVRAGASIDLVKPREASFLDGGAIGTSMFKKAPHPNAARVFANWFLSKDGSYLQSRVIGRQSARLDVPIDHIAADMRRDPSVKYVVTVNEEFNQRMANETPLAQEIFAPLLRK